MKKYILLLIVPYILLAQDVYRSTLIKEYYVEKFGENVVDRDTTFTKFFNTNNDLVHILHLINGQLINEKVFCYDDNWNLIKIVKSNHRENTNNYNENFSVNTTISKNYEYNSDNQILSENMIYNFQKNYVVKNYYNNRDKEYTDTLSNIKYEYYNTGEIKTVEDIINQLEYNSYSNRSFIDKEWKNIYNYNPQGNLLELTNYKFSDYYKKYNMIGKTIFSWDSFGDITEKNEYDSEGKLIYKHKVFSNDDEYYIKTYNGKGDRIISDSDWWEDILPIQEGKFDKVNQFDYLLNQVDGFSTKSIYEQQISFLEERVEKTELNESNQIIYKENVYFVATGEPMGNIDDILNDPMFDRYKKIIKYNFIPNTKIVNSIETNIYEMSYKFGEHQERLVQRNFEEYDYHIYEDETKNGFKYNNGPFKSEFRIIYDYPPHFYDCSYIIENSRFSLTEKREKLRICLNEGIMKHIKDEFKYPHEAKEQSITGKIYVTFIIDETGTIQDAKVVRGNNIYLKEEALRLVNGIPKMIPATQRNKPVAVPYTIPINFMLN